MRTPPVILIVFLLVQAGLAGAQDPIEPFHFFDDAEKTIEGQLFEDPLDHEGDVARFNGETWVTWLSFTRGEGERVWIGRHGKNGWIFRKRMTDQPGAYGNPTLTVTQGDDPTLWLSYEFEEGGQWEIYAGELNDRFDVEKKIKISDSPGADIDHRVVAADGGLWVVWQSDREGQFDIVARQITDEGDLTDTEVVSQSPGGDWRPDAITLSDGTLVVAWDLFNGNDYDVAFRAKRNGEWTAVHSITASPAFEGRVRLAAKSDDEVWATWEEGAEYWGHKYVSAYYPNKIFVSLTDERGPLHRFRKIRLAKIDIENGSVSHPTEPLPMPSIAEALSRNKDVENPMPIGAFYERGEIAFDGADRLWLVYRHWYAHLLGVAPNHHYEEGMGVFARCLDGGGWSQLYRLAPDQGDGVQRLSLAPTKDGVEALWTVGRTDRRPLKRPRGLVYASVTLDGDTDKRPIPVLEPETPGVSKAKIDNPKPSSAEFDGQDYHLVFGDLHRHTDLSLCMVPADGSLDDAYRYAIDVAQLDFLGVTDHSRDIARGNHLSQLWWRERKEVTRHRLTDVFFPYFAYERSRQDTDHNVISLRDDMLRPYEPPLPTFWEICDKDTFTLPHQPFFNSGLWEYNDNDRRPLLEIYQGCRDSTAEVPANEGLGLDYRFGFVASSDHLSTNASFASVWTDKVDRESIFRSLQARRTYGSTDKIRLAVRAGDHWMGEEFAAKEMPPIHVTAKGTGEISLIQFVVDGKREKTLNPNCTDVDLKESIDLSPGRHYVYVRLEQKDGNLAWASPFFVEIGE
ncbi:MAG: hypothetical protein KC944_03580 [Candidatus Omnitrophica bacterium]|nr:hypothetical protein [Candidatus Omnitrophota bacterium]